MTYIAHGKGYRLVIKNLGVLELVFEIFEVEFFDPYICSTGTGYVIAAQLGLLVECHRTNKISW